MESVLYVGTEDGVAVARSKDGRDWEVTARGVDGWEVPEVETVPGSPNTVVAGTRGDGIWVSQDFGESWVKPNRGKRGGPGKVRCVTVDPKNPRRLYVGCEPIDMFISEDLGQSWLRVESVWDDPFIATIPYPGAAVEPHMRDIAVDPANPDTMYAALQVGYMLKTEDGGETWRLLNKGLDCDVHTIVLDPHNSRHVYIATGGNDSRHDNAPGKALYVSEDAGESWTPLAMSFDETYSVPLTLDPSTQGIVYSAVASGPPGSRARNPEKYRSLNIRSLDAGKSWQTFNVGEDTGKQFPLAIVADEETPGRVYMALDDGRFYLSDDSGDTWERLNLKLDSVKNAKLTHV
jgi:photosystem II stability/assembly factor-like uncharacterized protein